MAETGVPTFRAASPGVMAGLLVSVSLTLFGCAPQTKTTAPPVEVPDTFSAPGTQPAPGRWWTAFGNERLNALVDSATASNLTLKTAWQRLQAARAVVDRESASLLPSIDASAQGEVRNTQPDGSGTEQLQFGLSAGYEVDLWGRLTSQVAAERFRARATRADYQTAALSLSAEVVRTWVRLAEARSQRRLVDRQIDTNQKVLNLLEARFKAGQIRSEDVLRQRQLLESTRQQRAAVETRVQELEHRLAVLLGRLPQTGVAAPPDTLPELPPLPATGVPANLVRRRPDVRRAYNLLKAADRDLAAAISNQYPRLTLTASASSATDGAQALFKDWAYAFAGDLLAPLFRGGALRAEVRRTEAVRTQRLYAYGQAVLTAFQDVEDALVREQQQRKQIQSLEAQVRLAQQSYEQLRVQYFNGAVDYLEVLTALEEVQQLRRDLLGARRELVEVRIALYRALAGGFDTGRGADE
ncbi:MAG: efflux transporter outer membrane subunit [Salinibacter sp.]